MSLPIQSYGYDRYTLNLERPQLQAPKLESPTLQAPSLPGTAPTGVTPGGEFVDQLKQFVGDVNGLQNQAESKTTAFANGQSNDIHGTMIAVQQADIALRMVGNFRNRIVEMYREVMRMGA
jgi:flagellar hook-basal body complex protein FliE